MTQINLKYAELHNPLFLCGMNCGTKLDLSNSKYAAMKLVYDRAEKELLVHWREEIGIIPSSNISAMIEGEAKLKAAPYTHPIVAGIGSAQVETPFGHVHAGPGQGKTGKSK